MDQIAPVFLVKQEPNQTNSYKLEISRIKPIHETHWAGLRLDPGFEPRALSWDVIFSNDKKE